MVMSGNRLKIELGSTTTAPLKMGIHSPKLPCPTKCLKIYTIAKGQQGTSQGTLMLLLLIDKSAHSNN